ncbi:MAG: class I SAM-dependent methyltransferase [Leptolyngbyaceae cyanobacterium CSU_1_3]|nr:class I SAM-dependent methyltransferase [Leptolyngbyaceae cyanobacterium CSU_1_3]
MEMALYHPQLGYYAANHGQIGARGDFFTSPHLGQDFGELLAEQFVTLWRVLGQPKPFTLVEMGAGQGLLSHDILSYLQRYHSDCFSCLQYVIVERSAAFVVEQKHRLQLWHSSLQIDWRSLTEIDPNSITGCFFSNELIDAFPVHLVTIAHQKLQEVYVSDRDQAFIEILDQPSTSRLTDYFNLVGIDILTYPEGYRTEVNLAALDWLQAVSDRLKRGFILTIDYGYPAARYYNSRRSQGTLQCYHQHSHHNNPYLHVGTQDITAHVDFTALERQGEQCGLENLEFTQQGLFLMRLGLGDRLMSLSQTEAKTAHDIQTVIRRRDAIHQLINPMGLGGFGVLLQGKQVGSQWVTSG